MTGGEGEPVAGAECRRRAERALAAEDPVAAVAWALLALLDEAAQIRRAVKRGRS